MAKAGFTKSFIPVANGGLGFGLVDFALAAEELARLDVVSPVRVSLLGALAQQITLEPYPYVLDVVPLTRAE